MSHVDEGLLAAYLDGELAGEAGAAEGIEGHLASCPECRTRLAEARRQHERARAILRGPGAPSASMPPFADIVARARTRDAERRDKRRISRLASLAWAATIVVAVGVGWYARQQSLLQVINAPPGVSEKTLANAPAESQAKAESTPAVTRANEKQAPIPAAPRQEPLADRKRTDVALEAQPSRKVAQAPAAPAPAPPPAVAPTEPGASAVGDKLAAGLDRGTPDSAPAQRLANRSTRLDEIAVTGQASSTESRGASAPRARSQATAAPRAAVAEAAPWTERSEEAAKTLLGRTPYRLPGLPVTEYAVRSSGGPAVRVTQLLAPATTLEIIQERGVSLSLAKERAVNESGDAGRVAGAAPGANFETMDIGAYRITVRAPLSRDSLQALLGRLR